MLALFALGIVTSLAACDNTSTTSQSTVSTTKAVDNSVLASTVSSLTKIKVVATTTQLGDFAHNIGGDRVEVYQILKPDNDPHDYEPTADDSKNAAAAQIIFKNGVGLDDWLGKVISNSGTKAPVIDTSAGIKTHDNDPHIWQSTEQAKIMVADVAKGLEQVDPTGKDYYESQLKSYQQQLDSLKTQIEQIFAPTPVSARKLVTNHDAFGYFTQEFNISVVGEIVPSFSDASQPTAQEITQLIKNIKNNQVKVIFTETTINPKVAQQVAKAANVKIYSNLYGDALGASGSDGDTYLKMELSNAKNMEQGFQLAQ